MHSRCKKFSWKPGWKDPIWVSKCLRSLLFQFEFTTWHQSEAWWENFNESWISTAEQFTYQSSRWSCGETSRKLGVEKSKYILKCCHLEPTSSKYLSLYLIPFKAIFFLSFFLFLSNSISHCIVQFLLYPKSCKVFKVNSILLIVVPILIFVKSLIFLKLSKSFCHSVSVLEISVPILIFLWRFVFSESSKTF